MRCVGRGGHGWDGREWGARFGDGNGNGMGMWVPEEGMCARGEFRDELMDFRAGGFVWGEALGMGLGAKAGLDGCLIGKKGEGCLIGRKGWRMPGGSGA